MPLGDKFPILVGKMVRRVYKAAKIQSYTSLQTPKSATPRVQMAKAKRVLQSLLKAGKGFSLLLMYIALTMSK